LVVSFERRSIAPSGISVHGTSELAAYHMRPADIRRQFDRIVRVIKSRRMRWDGHVAHMSEERGEKRPLGRPRRRWVDNIRMDLQEVGCGYMDWIGLAQDRESWRTLVSAVMNLRVP